MINNGDKTARSKAGNQIAAFRRQANLSQEALGAELGISAGQVSQLENGGTKLTWDRMQELAAIFGCHELDLVGTKPPAAPTRARRSLELPVIGISQAGHWTAQPQLDPEEYEYLILPEDSRYQGLARYALRVRGASMNRVLPHDSIAICVPMFELGREARVGEIVHVERRNHEGEYETTLKKLSTNAAGRLELAPHSMSPDHKDPLEITPASLGIEDGTEIDEHGPYIRIQGLVISKYQQL